MKAHKLVLICTIATEAQKRKLLKLCGTNCYLSLNSGRRVLHPNGELLLGRGHNVLRHGTHSCRNKWKSVKEEERESIASIWRQKKTNPRMCQVLWAPKSRVLYSKSKQSWWWMNLKNTCAVPMPHDYPLSDLHSKVENHDTLMWCDKKLLWQTKGKSLGIYSQLPYARLIPLPRPILWFLRKRPLDREILFILVRIVDATEIKVMVLQQFEQYNG